MLKFSKIEAADGSAPTQQIRWHVTDEDFVVLGTLTREWRGCSLELASDEKKMFSKQSDAKAHVRAWVGTRLSK